jgi:hypothetical protein
MFQPPQVFARVSSFSVILVVKDARVIEASMAFIPREEVHRPQNVAMKVRETDLSVFPKVQFDSKKREVQNLWEQCRNPLNEMLDRRQDSQTKVRTFREERLRDNGNLIRPDPVPFQPYKPREYRTKEDFHQMQEKLVHVQEEKKNAIAEHIAQSKNYSDNFSSQGREKVHRICLNDTRNVSDSVPGFKGLGQRSHDIFYKGKGSTEYGERYRHTDAPWLQSENPIPARRHNGNTSEGVLTCLQEMTPEPARYKVHKKLFALQTHTGGQPSPPGSFIPQRCETTTASQFAVDGYTPARSESALSTIRACTSMLP